MRSFYSHMFRGQTTRRVSSSVVFAIALFMASPYGFAADTAQNGAVEVRRLQPHPWQSPLPPQAVEGTTRLVVHVIGFGGKTDATWDRIARDFATKSTQWDAFAIVDASNGSIVVSDDGGSPSREDRRPGIFRALRERFQERASTPDVDLSAALQAVSDVLRSYAGRLKSADVFLLDALLHKAGDVDFTAGYPNDGFLVLDDNPFAYVSGAATPNSKFHVLFTSQPKHPQEYQRFASLLFQQLFSAPLATFSSNNVEGELSQIAIAPPDTGVTRSVVVRPDAKPVCAYDDDVALERTQDYRVTVRVRNPCRANSVVSFLVNGKPANADGDATGLAVLSSRLVPGSNSIDVLNLSGSTHNVMIENVPSLDDKIAIKLTNDGVVLEGYNPLRPDDSEVQIVHTGSGRSWRIRVRDDRWHLEAPLSPGRHIFEVSPLNGGVAQKVEVSRIIDVPIDFMNSIYSKGGESGYVQIGLKWNDKNDLDLFIKCPSGEYVGHDRNVGCGGSRDVDRNLKFPYESDPAENVVWKEKPAPGTYEVGVNYYANHEKPKSIANVFVIIDGVLVFKKQNIEITEASKGKTLQLYTFTIR